MQVIKIQPTKSQTIVKSLTNEPKPIKEVKTKNFKITQQKPNKNKNNTLKKEITKNEYKIIKTENSKTNEKDYVYIGKGNNEKIIRDYFLEKYLKLYYYFKER